MESDERYVYTILQHEPGLTFADECDAHKIISNLGI